jgi:hypothetical protein
MKRQHKYTVDEKKLKGHLPKVLNSGLFLTDSSPKPIGLFKLRNDRNKELCIRPNSIVSDVPGLNVRIMARKLNRIIYCYKNNTPHSIYLTFDWDVDDDVNQFEVNLKKYLEDRMFELDELQPHLDSFIKKARRILKNQLEKDWYPNSKKPKAKGKEQWFYNLIAPLYAVFSKYLTDRKTLKRKVNQTNIFHYISHLLIACGIEKIDPQRGHMPLFEKIKQYNRRHSKYLKQ